MRTYQFALTFALLTVFAQPVTMFSQDAPTKAAPEQVYDVRNGVKPPRAIYAPDPEYTDKARKERQQGTVVIKMVVGSDGLPRDIKVSRTLSPEFDKAAIDAVKKWKFTPATRDSKPIAVEIDVEMAFRLY